MSQFLNSSLSFADEDSDNNYDNMILYDAIEEQDYEEVTSILKIFSSDYEIDGNYVHPESGESYLTLALQLEDKDIIQLLLQQGGDFLNTYNQRNESPLIVAAKHQKVKTIGDILALGADANHVDNKSHNFAYYMLERSTYANSALNLKYENLLIKALNLYHFDASFEDSYHLKFYGKGKKIDLLTFALKAYYPALASAIVERPEKLDHEKDYLCHALVGNQDDLMSLLIEKGAGVNVSCGSGNTPMHLAVKRNLYGSVQILAEENAELNKINKAKKSPLLIAAEDCNYSVAGILIEYGADPTEVFPIMIDGKMHLMNILEYAQYYKDTKLLEILVESIYCDPMIKESFYEHEEDFGKVSHSSMEIEPEHPDDPAMISFLKELNVKSKTFNDIYVGRVPSEIQDLISIIKLDERIVRQYDPDHKQTILFFGPTGTGKTTLAHAIAADCQYRVFKLVPSIIISKYIGESEGRLAELFKRLKNYINDTGEKIIIFIDEVDSLLTKRGGEGSNVTDFNNKISAVFLEYFGEGSDQEQKEFLRNVILIGATNAEKDMPANVLSRFFYKVEMPNPDASTRLAILNHYLGKLSADKVDISEADRYEMAHHKMADMSSRLITHIVQKAARKALIRRANLAEGDSGGIVTIEDLKAVIEELSKDNKEKDDRWKQLYT